MSEPAKKSPSREAPAPPEPARRVAPRRATADRRLRILERLTTGLTVAHIAREEGLSVQRIRRIIAEMLESREIDPPAGFVQLQIARLSEAMIVARTMTRRAMSARWVGGSNSTVAMASRSRCFRFPRKPRRHGSQSGRGANCWRRIRRGRKPRGNFSWLQSLEIPRNGIGIGGPWCWCDAPAGSRSRMSRRSRPQLMN